MLVALLAACLVSSGLHEHQSALLADEDGDGFVARDDCDDTDPSTHPGAPERCDGEDDDCDGEVDEQADDATVWFADEDGDGIGTQAQRLSSCEAPDGYVASGGDCDDHDAATPSDVDIPYDGKDNDCDGSDLTDVDGDGYDAELAGGDDCDDDDITINPGAKETWENGATDDDCDGDYGPATTEYGDDAWTGEAAGDRAGHRVSGLGDLDGDGLAEFLVAAPYASESTGRVYLVDGPEPGPLGEEVRLVASSPGWMLGLGLDGGPDVNGDGIADMLIGGPGWGDATGAAWILSGADLADADGDVSVDDAAEWTGTGNDAGDYAAATVAFLGDLDGDGIDDVGYTSPGMSSSGLSLNGGVGVWTDRSAGGSLSDADLVVRGFYDGALMGTELAPAGDQDDDGYGDFMVGYGSGVIAQVLPGGAASIDTARDALAEVVKDGDVTGAPRMIGDVDGDGSPDLAVILDYADVLVFTELDSNPVRTTGMATSTVSVSGKGSYCFDVTSLNDLDGDGREETFVALTEANGDKTARGSVVFGTSIRVGAEVPFEDLSLVAVSRRIGSGFGYRSTLAGDVDGLFENDILLGGPTDADAAVDAGAVIIIAAPQ